LKPLGQALTDERRQCLFSVADADNAEFWPDDRYQSLMSNVREEILPEIFVIAHCSPPIEPDNRSAASFGALEAFIYGDPRPRPRFEYWATRFTSEWLGQTTAAGRVCRPPEVRQAVGEPIPLISQR